MSYSRAPSVSGLDEAPSKKRMVICGNYGICNVGDEAILYALVQRFSPEYELTVMSADPEKTSGQFSVPCVARFPSGLRSFLRLFLSSEARRRFRQTIKAIRLCDVFVLGGGTLLTDEPWKSIWIWGMQVEVAFHYDRPVWIHANGIGPFRHGWAKAWAKSILKRSDSITVRDRRSLKWVQDFGLNCVSLCPDPVLDWKISSFEKLPHFPKNYLVFVPRYWTKNMFSAIEEFKKFVHYLTLEKGEKVVGIPFEKNNKKDIDLLNTIFDQIPKESVRLWSDYESELEVLGAIAHCELLIGMRLHSLIFAQKTHVPFIGISYMEKVEALGEDLGKSDCVISFEDLSFEKLRDLYIHSISKKHLL